MRKISILIVPVVLLCLLFSACGAAAPEESTSATTEPLMSETTAVTTAEPETSASTTESETEAVTGTTPEQTAATSGETEQPTEDRTPLEIHMETVANAETVRIKFSPLMVVVDPDYVEYEGSIYGLAEDFGTYCTIRDEAIIDEIREHHSTSVVMESKSWYRTMPTVLLTFCDPEGNSCTYYFLQDYDMHEGRTDVGIFYYTVINGERVVYCMDESAVAYFEELFAVFTLKNIPTWED